jgi:translation initiation factor 4E
LSPHLLGYPLPPFSVHKRWPSASNLSIGSDYYLFREGIQPNWEDEMNVRGGRWQASIPGKQYLPGEKSAANLDNIWLELKMSVIGAQYGVDNPKVCGVAAHVRYKQDKVGD